MELKLGKVSSKFLAEWFGITANSFSRNRTKKLEELKLFAEFYEEGKKIVITKIINPVYTKQGSTSYLKIKNNIDENWSDSGLDSCSTVSLKIKESLGDELAIQDTTIYNYTRRGRNELYGKPFLGGGILGSCEYIWCKKQGEGAETKYLKLTDEEEEMKQKLIKKYFGDATEKQILVKGMVEAGEISSEEAWDVLVELTNMGTGNFMMFLAELQEKIGCQVVRGTMVTKNNTAFLES